MLWLADYLDEVELEAEPEDDEADDRSDWDRQSDSAHG